MGYITLFHFIPYTSLHGSRSYAVFLTLVMIHSGGYILKKYKKRKYVNFFVKNYNEEIESFIERVHCHFSFDFFILLHELIELQSRRDRTSER